MQRATALPSQFSDSSGALMSFPSIPQAVRGFTLARRLSVCQAPKVPHNLRTSMASGTVGGNWGRSALLTVEPCIMCIIMHGRTRK